MARIAEDHPATVGSVTLNSGFFWAIETASGESFNDAQVRALASAFRLVGPSHARLMEQPPLALAFAQIADFFRRTWPDLLRANGCMFPLPPLAPPSGALGYAYLAAWPALLTELEHQGVWATGPILHARAAPASTHSRRGSAPLLRGRLVFDPARVGPRGGHTWLERPGPGMLELGHPGPTGISMAGIDYSASEGSAITAGSARLADPAVARTMGGQPPIWVAHRDGQPLPRHFATTVATALDTAVQATGVRDAVAVRADLRLMLSRRAAVVRLGHTASATLRDATYVRFVRLLAEALTEGGASAAAVLETRYVSAPPWDQLTRDAAVYIVSPDADLSATRLVHMERTLAEPQPAGDALQAEHLRLSAAIWGSRVPLVVSWLPERESPLFGRTPPPVETAHIQVYVKATAGLPLTVSRRARVARPGDQRRPERSRPCCPRDRPDTAPRGRSRWPGRWRRTCSSGRCPCAAEAPSTRSACGVFSRWPPPSALPPVAPNLPAP